MGKPVLPQFAGSDNEGERLYKLKQLVDELQRFVEDVQAQIGNIDFDTSGLAPIDASFITVDDETATLTGSRQLVAGVKTSINTANAGEIAVDVKAYPPQLGYAGIL